MMKKAIDVLKLIFLLNQVTHIFGKLTAFHSSLNPSNLAVTCVSEDDGGALTMNYVVDRFLYATTTNFSDTCKSGTKYIICNMNDGINCLNSWDSEGWEVTNSMDTPMGPVLDRRWEAFKKHSLEEYYISLKNMNTIVVPFSVFVVSDLNILLCKNKNKTGLCYWIIIGGVEDTKTIIRKCPKGVPQIEKYAHNYVECTENVYINHNALSRYEWRTYVLIWNSATQNISLYNFDHLLMSYEDKENYESPTIFQGIFFSSPRTRYAWPAIRYHNYSFLFTRQQKSLRSNEFPIGLNGICLQFLIGLCEVCGATITLINMITRNTIGSVVVNGTSSVHGLPTWQLVKIKNNVLTSNKVIVILKPRLLPPRNNHSSLMWAIGMVRECPPKGCLRIKQNVVYASYRTSDSMTCQKIFYHEPTVVNLLSDINLNIELDNTNCDLGYIGPHCSLMCETVLGTDKNCRGVTVCNTNGCTCPPGFQEPNCNKPCNEGLYGHACKKSCGSCRENKCGPTGICATGCESSADYTYIPPVCQIGISKPGEPELVLTSRTTVMANVPFKWEKNYNKQKLFYLFRIKTLDGRLVSRKRKKQIFENTTQLIGMFENLKFDTFYQVLCILFIDQLEIPSDWKTVETDCDLPHAPQKFTSLLESNGMVDLKWLSPRKTCGHDLCCFRIIIQIISSNLGSNISQSFKNETIEYSVIYNARDYTKRLNLLPSTVYNISIQTMTTSNETGNANYLQFKTLPSVGLGGKLQIWSKKSDPLIILSIPEIVNDTSDSMSYIIIIGPDICEQTTTFPKNLLDHIDKDKINHVWQIVERPTNVLANQSFPISDNHSGKCPLKDKQLYEVMFFITDMKCLNESVILKHKTFFYFNGPPPTYHAVWFIGVTVFFAAISGAFYFYKK